ncbi:MAG: NADPH-dependent oxidoreductase [Mediterranea sp.]|jgi:nitroreductase|nr:NADPH-dependent oxidoreductase [Mediterranea sp.]
MIDSVKSRRTIRRYEARGIDSSLLNDLLEASFRASTLGGMQLYSVVVTRDEAMKAKLSPAHFGQPMVKGAPVVLTFCADFHRFSLWCERREAVPGYDNLMSFLNASMDTLLVAQTFCTLAEEAGLGICYLGTTTYNPQMIIDTLRLPKLVFPITTITVGYPAETPAQVDRLPLEAAVHQETYRDYAPADIDRLYAYKESLPESRKFVEENGKRTLAQVFTDVRYTKADNEAMTANLLKVLREQGFISSPEKPRSL